ncbi:MAG: Hpt domain-containing protein [Opitutaceae bacterium]|nr:Hpt domain-containing protein [Opitutaceae bacterium]
MAHHRHDRPRHPERPGPLSGGGDERLHHQADHARGAARGVAPLAARRQPTRLPTESRARAPGAPASDSDAPAPIFDHDALLARVLNDPQLVRTLASKFLEDLPHTAEKLQVSLLANDTKNATLHAHAIKGAAANMGGEWLRQTAAAMETAGRAGDAIAMKALLPELQERMVKLQAAIQTALGGQATP